MTINTNEVQKIIESNGSGTGTESPPTVTLDIGDNIVSGLSTEGQTTTYSGGTDTMKVTRKNNVGSTGFNLYIHTLAAGGMFTLNQQINNATKTAPLQDVTNPISNVYEGYFYKEDTGSKTKGALKIKTMGETKIFYKTDVTQTGGTWKDEATTDPTAFSNLFTTIKDEVEIKLEKTTY